MLSSNSLAYLSQGMLLLPYNDHFGSPCLVGWWGAPERRALVLFLHLQVARTRPGLTVGTA